MARATAIAVVLLRVSSASALAAPMPAASHRATSAHSSPAAGAPKHSKAARGSRGGAGSGLSAAELARDARGLEEIGGYSRAAETLRALRAKVAPDADLELALALDEARCGQLDSARVRLWRPLLTSALADSTPEPRRHAYPWSREALWLNGRFDGWNWYIARARAEVAAMLGMWSEAHTAALAAVAAHPLAGTEWLLLAVCAGRDAARGEAELAAARAAQLDPTLAEAQYLVGLYDWKGGRQNEAGARFRAAVTLDSTFQTAALALVRSRLPGVQPDTLPTFFLSGVREVGMLTSAARPKLEEFVEMDSPAMIIRRGQPVVPDSAVRNLKPVQLILEVLVDERGRAALLNLPWFRPEQLPAPVISALLASLPDWRFSPAKRNGVAQRVWAAVEYAYTPPGTAGAPKR